MEPQAKTPSARSPISGCLILVIGLCVMIFLVAFSVRIFFQQMEEVGKFTDVQPSEVRLEDLSGREQALASLDQRIVGFQKNLSAGQSCELKLGVDDLNLAIAAYEPLKELRRTFRVEAIENGKMRVQISFPMNGRVRQANAGEKGILVTEPRYLNARMWVVPTWLKDELVLKIESIEVPGKEVPQGFIDLMSPYRITEVYTQDPRFGPLMKRITGAGIVEGSLQIRLKSGEVKVDEISNQTVDTYAMKILQVVMIVAVVFLTMVGMILWVGLRAKRKKEMAGN